MSPPYVHNNATRDSEMLSVIIFFFCLGLLSIRVEDPMSDSPIMYRGGDSPLSMYVTLLYIFDALTRTSSIAGKGGETSYWVWLWRVGLSK
jgi:hypothetical protein